MYFSPRNKWLHGIHSKLSCVILFRPLSLYALQVLSADVVHAGAEVAVVVEAGVK